MKYLLHHSTKEAGMVGGLKRGCFSPCFLPGKRRHRTIKEERLRSREAEQGDGAECGRGEQQGALQ